MKTRVLAIMLSLVAGLQHLSAQGTAFTYQGHLTDGGSPANGIYDLNFSLYDTDQPGGNLLAGPVSNVATTVTNGGFVVTLDFGSQFDGNQRWLEVSVQTNGGSGFITLIPRQHLTPTPYAIYAGNASNVVSGAAVTSLNSLHDDVTLAAGTNITITPSGNTLTVAAQATAGEIWNLNDTNAYYNAGKVGIGTTTPSHQLSISGGPGWTANGWKGAVDLANASAFGWQNDAAGQSFGIGQTGGGLYFFHTASSPGTTGSAANYSMNITDTGTVNINSLTVGTLAGNLEPAVNNEYSLGGNVFYGSWASVSSYAFINPSDARLKKNIEPLPYGLDELMRLRPVTYQWKDGKDPRTQLGLIAQEVMPVIPEVVSGSTETNSRLGINYSELIPLVIKAVQEQQAAINSLKSDDAALKARNAALESRLELIEQKIENNNALKPQ